LLRSSKNHDSADFYGVGARVGDFELPDLEGRPRRFSDLAGAWTVLYFTASWCPYCSAEAPYIEAEVGRFAEQGVRLVIIDVKEEPAAAALLPQRFGWQSPFLIDGAGLLSSRFAPQKEGLPPEVAIINGHLILDQDLKVRYAEYLNLERFDAHVASLTEALAALVHTEGAGLKGAVGEVGSSP
jgi:peroxiredoxin